MSPREAIDEAIRQADKIDHWRHMTREDQVQLVLDALHSAADGTLPPAMTRAGALELAGYSSDFESAEDVVARIFSAMLAANQAEPIQDTNPA